MKRNRIRLSQRQRPRQYLKTTLKIGVASCFAIALVFSLVVNFSRTEDTMAAASGDYRSKASGNWNNVGTWERYTGVAWVAAIATPTSANGVITLRNGYTVTVTANVSVDQVVVESGATLTISSGTLTVANGTGSDLDISGTANLNAGGTVSISSSALINISSGGIYNYNGGSQTTGTGWAVNNGGTYVHNVNGIDIPNGTWGATSTLKITGVVNTDPDVQSQTFGNLIYDCAGQTANLDFKDKLTVVSGDFTVANTGTGSIKFDKSSTNMTLNVGGNFFQTGGTLKITNQGNWNINVTGNFNLSGGTFVMAGSDGVPGLTVNGNANITGGTLDMSQYTGNTSSKGIGTLNLIGNFSQTGGTITETATGSGKGDFNFAKTGTQTFSITGGTITNTVNFTVNTGSILDAGNNTFTGSGTFTVASGGSIILGSANGISSSGATGNIQVTGTRTFSSGGNYTYAGTSAQITGNGLPASVNNFTINNASGVTLSQGLTVTSTLTFTSGTITTNSDTITLGTSQSNTGTLVRTSGHVVGKIKRWMSSSSPANNLFPVGTASTYNGANISFTSGSTGGSITGTFINQLPSYNGLSIWEAPVWIHTLGMLGYWSFTSSDGFAGGNYNLNLCAYGFVGIGDYTAIRVIYRPDAASGWRSNGTHALGTGSNALPVGNRTGMTALGQFGIGGEGMNPLPVKLVAFTGSYKDRSVGLNWKTASELNNDFFTVYRSADGENFEPVGTVKGSGNSTTEKNYSFEDFSPLDGVSFYRLSQTDYDGTTEEHSTISVDAGNSAKQGKPVVYFKPSENSIGGHFFLEHDGSVKLSVYNSNGALLRQISVSGTQGRNEISMSLEGIFSTGMYFLSVEKSDGKADVCRFLKQ